MANYYWKKFNLKEAFIDCFIKEDFHPHDFYISAEIKKKICGQRFTQEAGNWVAKSHTRELEPINAQALPEEIIQQVLKYLDKEHPI